MIKISRYALLASLVVCPFLFAEVSRYPSGLFQSMTAESGTERTTEDRARASFLRKYFPQLGSDARWVEEKVFRDRTHVHRTYYLEVKGRRVADHTLKTHFNNDGFIQYATSSWSVPFDAAMLRFPEHRDQGMIEKVIRRQLARRHGAFTGRLTLSPTLWLDKKAGTLRPAFDTEVTGEKEGIYRRLIVDESDGKFLDERRAVRNATVPNQKVYLSSPLGKDITTFDTADLTELTDTSSLSNSFVKVRREQLVSNVRTLYDVDPTIDYTTGPMGDALPFSLDPDDYDATNASTASVHPNHSFDSVNVYYHLTNYRRTIDNYFSTLGLQGNLSAVLTDPLDAIVNFLNLVDGEFDSNNAAYIGQTCRTSPATIARCLVFFMPATIPTRACGDGSVQFVKFYHLAREANVIVHEFQHYLTDRITGMIPGSGDLYNVGDALHEGYSDYFGASEVEALDPTQGTSIGKYSFQNCSPIIRDVSTLRVYKNDEEDADPHSSGLSWASGLWNLRAEFGKEVADILAYKSLFFLSTEPSFVEAVESLVKADRAQYDGAHVARIRRLFYDEIKFVGGQSGIYRDVENGIVEMGFRGCSSTHLTTSRSGWISILLLTVWLFGTVRAGGWMIRRKTR